MPEADVTARRAKESYGEALELVPIRLIGGFVCVDTHLGCAGCGFCLNRRYPAQRRVLESRAHRSWAEVGWPPERVAALAAGLPAVTRARVPVRFGHASDLVFQEDGAVALLRALPHDRSALLLTRFPVSATVARAVAGHPGALLHLSLAPPVGNGSKGAGDPREALAAAASVPPEQLFVLFGPLVEGSAPALERLLPLVPRGAAVGFKPLAIDGLPFDSESPPASAAELLALAAQARVLGLEVPPLAGCRLRGRLKLPFFRHCGLVAQDGSACDGCVTKAACTGVAAPRDESLCSEAARLGLIVHDVRREAARILLEVDAPAARADEIFLSERFGWPVHLSTVARAEGFRVVELPAEVFERWERHGIFPASALREAAMRMVARL
jgi:hypothetical protein